MWTRCNLVLTFAAAGLLFAGCEGTAEDLAKKSKAESEKALAIAEDLAKQATAESEKALATAEEKGKELASKSSEIAGQLGEQAMALLGPLKEKIAGLEGLADKPAELKTKVSELLGALDNNMANLPVPEAVKSGLAALKEQLTKLLEYLGGEVDTAKIQEYLNTIKEIVGSKLGS
jgi:hypothetical protein